MLPEVKSVRQTFERAGWNAIPPPADALQVGFTNSYATVGILIADGVDQILSTWERAQDALREMRNSDPDLRDKDAYLVIIVPTIDAQDDGLREVLDNTYVCRKLCIEIDGRTVEEALKELPFFAISASKGKLSVETEIGSSAPDLPELLLQDLRKASADVVLDRLLQGKYKRGGE